MGALWLLRFITSGHGEHWRKKCSEPVQTIGPRFVCGWVCVGGRGVGGLNNDLIYRELINNTQAKFKGHVLWPEILSWLNNRAGRHVTFKDRM